MGRKQSQPDRLNTRQRNSSSTRDHHTLSRRRSSEATRNRSIVRNQLIQERNGDRNERKNSALSINENEKNKNSGRLRERADIKEESSSRLRHPIKRDKKSVKSTQGSSQKSTKVRYKNLPKMRSCSVTFSGIEFVFLGRRTRVNHHGN